MKFIHYHTKNILDEVSSLSHEESCEDRSSIEIVLSNETIGVDFSSSSLKEFFDEATNDTSRFLEVIPSYFNCFV